MQVIFRSYSAHPLYGTAQPGQRKDVPDDLAQDLLAGGYVEPVTPESAGTESGQAGSPESAALTGMETAMASGARPRKRATQG